MSEPDIDDVKELDGHVRLIVLHETEPFSDTYMQVMLPREACAPRTGVPSRAATLHEVPSTAASCPPAEPPQAITRVGSMP